MAVVEEVTNMIYRSNIDLASDMNGVPNGYIRLHVGALGVINSF